MDMNGLNVDLNRVRLFLEIVKIGNISKTAELLALQKSKVSRDLSLLEQELGVQLIYRTTRQFNLTIEGQKFFEKANESLKILGEAISHTSTDSKKLAGHVAITSPEDVGQVVLIPLLQEFSKLYPQITFNIQFSNEILDLVTNKLDLAIRIGPLKNHAMNAKKVGKIECGLYCSSTFYEKFADSSSVEELTKLPTVYFQGKTRKPTWSLEINGIKNKIELNPIATVSSSIAALELIRGGMGISLLPKFIVERDIIKGNLVHIFKDWKSNAPNIHILSSKLNEEPARIRVLSQFLEKKMMRTF